MLRSMQLAALLAAASLSVSARGAGAVATPDTRVAIEALQTRILERNAEGALDNRRARRALRDLDEIRHIDSAYRRDGGPPGPEQTRDILSRLDALRLAVSSAPAQRAAKAHRTP